MSHLPPELRRDLIKGLVRITHTLSTFEDPAQAQALLDQILAGLKTDLFPPPSKAANPISFPQAKKL
jgi:hypothetical protein